MRLVFLIVVAEPDIPVEIQFLDPITDLDIWTLRPLGNRLFTDFSLEFLGFLFG